MRKQDTKRNPGERIFFNGDIDNKAGFGTIIGRKENGMMLNGEYMPLGVNLTVGMDDGREIYISEGSIEDEYAGNGSTRFVTEEAYCRWKGDDQNCIVF